jgi:hypothetical protein
MTSGDNRADRANSYDNRDSSSFQQSYNNESLKWNEDNVDSQYNSNQYDNNDNITEEREIIDGKSFSYINPINNYFFYNFFINCI